MATLSGWPTEAPAVNSTASFEIEDLTPAKIALNSDELYGSELPLIVGNSDALRKVLAWCVSWPRPTRPY